MSGTVKVLHPGTPPIERWVVLALKDGTWEIVQLFPKRFPICGSAAEAMDRVQIRMGTDPAFKQRWWGWHFVPAAMHCAVKNGAQTPLTERWGARQHG